MFVSSGIIVATIIYLLVSSVLLIVFVASSSKNKMEDVANELTDRLMEMHDDFDKIEIEYGHEAISLFHEGLEGTTVKPKLKIKVERNGKT